MDHSNDMPADQTEFMLKEHTRSPSPHSDYDSHESTESSHNNFFGPERMPTGAKRGGRQQNRDRGGGVCRNDKRRNQDSRGYEQQQQMQQQQLQQRTNEQLKDDGICVFYMQGKCNKVRILLSPNFYNRDRQ